MVRGQNRAVEAGFRKKVLPRLPSGGAGKLPAPAGGDDPGVHGPDGDREKDVPALPCLAPPRPKERLGKNPGERRKAWEWIRTNPRRAWRHPPDGVRLSPLEGTGLHRPPSGCLPWLPFVAPAKTIRVGNCHHRISRNSFPILPMGNPNRNQRKRVPELVWEPIWVSGGPELFFPQRALPGSLSPFRREIRAGNRQRREHRPWFWRAAPAWFCGRVAWPPVFPRSPPPWGWWMMTRFRWESPFLLATNLPDCAW